MSDTPKADRLRRRLTAWTIVLGLVAVVLLSLAASVTADAAMTAFMVGGAFLAAAIMAVFIWMRVRLEIAAGRAD